MQEEMYDETVEENEEVEVQEDQDDFEESEDFDGEEGEDPVLAFTPSVAQGFGNTQRTRGYELANDHGGLMDTSITGTLEWKIADGVTFSAYVTYADYWFDRRLRHGAREYNGAWSHSDKYANSWNIWGGLAINVEF